MKIIITQKLNKGIWEPVNAKGAEEIEIETAEITNISKEKKNRYIGLGKQGLFRLSSNSWTALRKSLIKTNRAHMIS